MDYQSFVDCIDRPCAIVSVDRQDRGVRIMCANQSFKDVSPAKTGYYDGMYYHEHMPRNPKFEDFCYHAAVGGEAGHVYAEYPTGWIDQQVIPMKGDETAGLCLFTFELTESPEVRRLSTVSVDVTKFAIRSSIILMSSEDFREGVRTVLEGALSICGAHNSRLLLLDHRNRSVRNYCEAVSELDLRRDNHKLTYDFIKTWERCVGDSNALLLTSERDFDDLAEQAPEWADNLREFNIQSLALFPLRRGNEIFGYIDFINFDSRTAAEVSDVAEMLTVILSAELLNHQLMERLEEMSTTDALTGLKNRNAMLRKMETIGEETFGVVNFDLNGLKHVNDTEGHDAGDRLLVEAAEALKKVFYYEDIFRTGGDEFIALLPGISRESFERKLIKFREALQKNQEVSFAFGSFWSDGSVDMTTAFRAADNAMYEDKKAYYCSHPEHQRK